MIKRPVFDEDDQPCEGWTWPLGLRKAHYVLRGVSLCGELTFEGEPDRLDRRRFDQCAGCRERLRKVQDWRRDADRRGVHGEAQA